MGRSQWQLFQNSFEGATISLSNVVGNGILMEFVLGYNVASLQFCCQSYFSKLCFVVLGLNGTFNFYLNVNITDVRPRGIILTEWS